MFLFLSKMIAAISISVFTYLLTYAKERFSSVLDKLWNNFSAIDWLNLSRTNKASSRVFKVDNLTIISCGKFSWTAK